MAVCESCAGEDEELEPVWPATSRDGQEPELWCSDCRERLPHEPAEAEEADDY